MINPYATLIIIILIIYITYCKFNRLIYPEITLEDLISNDKFKTGDMIFFRNYSTKIPYVSLSYFSHVGVVYKENDKLMILEINYKGFFKIGSLSHYNEVNNSDLIKRIERTKGKIFYKELAYPVTKKIESEFLDFVNFMKTNARYEICIPFSCISKHLYNDPHSLSINCTDLTFYSLYKLGLLKYDRFKQPPLHLLNYLYNIEESDMINNKYKDLVEIIIFEY